MSEDQLEREVLGRAAIDRRSFIKKVIVGSAFAVPLVASFDMFAGGQASGSTCATPNSTSGQSGSGVHGGTGGTKAHQSLPGACGGTPDGGTGGSPSGQKTFSDRQMKTDVVAVVWDAE